MKLGTCSRGGTRESSNRLAPDRLAPWIAIGLAAMLCIPVQAERVSYSFTKLSTLGQKAPGGGNHINDFEPGALNNHGDAIYGTDLGTSADPATFIGEGVFIRQGGRRRSWNWLAAREAPQAVGYSMFFCWARPFSMIWAMAHLHLHSAHSVPRLDSTRAFTDTPIVPAKLRR